MLDIFFAFCVFSVALGVGHLVFLTGVFMNPESRMSMIAFKTCGFVQSGVFFWSMFTFGPVDGVLGCLLALFVAMCISSRAGILKPTIAS